MKSEAAEKTERRRDAEHEFQGCLLKTILCWNKTLWLKDHTGYSKKCMDLEVECHRVRGEQLFKTELSRIN